MTRGPFLFRYCGLVGCGGVACLGAANCFTCAAAPAVTNMSYGDLVSCSIDVAGETRLARFSGQMGEVVSIGIVRTAGSGSSDVCFRLIAVDGTPGGSVCAGKANYVGAPYNSYAGSGQTLPASGTYTIQVLEGSGAQTIGW